MQFIVNINLDTRYKKILLSYTSQGNLLVIISTKFKKKLFSSNVEVPADVRREMPQKLGQKSCNPPPTYAAITTRDTG